MNPEWFQVQGVVATNRYATCVSCNLLGSLDELRRTLPLADFLQKGNAMLPHSLGMLSKQCATKTSAAGLIVLIHGLLVLFLAAGTAAWAGEPADAGPHWPLIRNGVSQKLGNTTYFNSPDLNYSSQRLGNTEYYSGHNRKAGSSFSGSSQQLGNTTYYQVQPHGTGGGFSGSSYAVGGTTYYNGQDRSSGKRISGSSYRLGTTTYYDFREEGSGKRHSWSAQPLGNSTYYHAR